eukprot:1182811-Pyramimonas_sp.AAC.1
MGKSSIGRGAWEGGSRTKHQQAGEYLLPQRPWGPPDSARALQRGSEGSRWPRASSLPLFGWLTGCDFYPRPRAAQEIECSQSSVSQHGQVLVFRLAAVDKAYTRQGAL